MQNILKINWKSKTNDWIEERFPESRQVTLNLKRIFVFPTASSLALLIAIILLFVMGVNFQNSLAYGLCFWLLALIVIAIYFTYGNLSGVTIKAIKSQNCFAGEKAVFEVNLSCPTEQKKSAIHIGWKDQDLALVDLNDSHSATIKLSHNTTKRGRFKPERLNIFTRYPVGLVIAWSYAQLDMQSIVYPAPILQNDLNNSQTMDDEAEQGLEIARGTTDFSGVQKYQAGDSPKHIHWGAYAKTGKVFSKTFVDYASHDLWLEFDALLAIQGTETKLSHLCALVLQYNQEQQTYGLKLPDRTIQPASGDAHKNTCLIALALFGDDRQKQQKPELN
ncbi:MAG: DUF58 domain-containing protein [Cocleimonas sp.]